MTIRGINNAVRVIGVPVESLVRIGGLYKMMTSSISFDDDDNKVVVGDTDFDQYIAHFKSPATRRKNNMNNTSDSVIVIVIVESSVESSVESLECNGIMETKLYRNLHTHRKIGRALNRDDETGKRRESKSNDEMK